jgi:hypothetical protein
MGESIESPSMGIDRIRVCASVPKRRAGSEAFPLALPATRERRLEVSGSRAATLQRFKVAELNAQNRTFEWQRRLAIQPTLD